MPPAPLPAPRRRAAAARRAFTLVELLVTTAIVVVLMAAVAGVFKVAGDTVGTGAALASITRDARAAQFTFRQDFEGLAKDGAWLYIANKQETAYASREVEQTDNGAIRTLDLNGNNAFGEASVSGEQVRNAIYDSRNHRLDRVTFFARGDYQRQTGNDGTFVSPTGSSEALIRYRLMSQKNTAGAWRLPVADSADQPTNDTNRYPTQWLLGRQAILLTENPPAGEFHFGRSTLPAPPPNATPPGNSLYPPLPLNTGASANDPLNSQLFTNRFDLAQTSIEGYRNIFARRALGGTYGGAAYGRVINWWIGSEGTVDTTLYAYPFPQSPARQCRRRAGKPDLPSGHQSIYRGVRRRFRFTAE